MLQKLRYIPFMPALLGAVVQRNKPGWNRKKNLVRLGAIGCERVRLGAIRVGSVGCKGTASLEYSIYCARPSATSESAAENMLQREAGAAEHYPCLINS